MPQFALVEGDFRTLPEAIHLLALADMVWANNFVYGSNVNVELERVITAHVKPMCIVATSLELFLRRTRPKSRPSGVISFRVCRDAGSVLLTVSLQSVRVQTDNSSASPASRCLVRGRPTRSKSILRAQGACCDK